MKNNNNSKNNTPNAELIITRGISNSGKSTEARKWVAEDPVNRRRVNRDDCRAAGFNIAEYTPEQEELVTAFQQGAVRVLLAAGRSVIVDDMFLHARYVRPFYNIAQELNVDFSIREFPVELEVALLRAKKRAKEGGLMVPEVAIRKMFKYGTTDGQLRPLPDFSVNPNLSKEREDAYKVAVEFPYIADVSLPKAAIVDVDGTLTSGIHPDRGPFDWPKVGLDEPNHAVIDMVKMLKANDVKIIVTSGRSDVCRSETMDWLKRHDIESDSLFMRAGEDRAPDNIVKMEIFDREIRDKYNVVAVLDDRGSVCRLWHELALPLFRVGNPFSDF